MAKIAGSPAYRRTVRMLEDIFIPTINLYMTKLCLLASFDNTHKLGNTFLHKAPCLLKIPTLCDFSLAETERSNIESDDIWLLIDGCALALWKRLLLRCFAIKCLYLEEEI